MIFRKFYKKYLNFFNNKLQIIAEEIAKKMPENVKIIDGEGNKRLAGKGKNIIAREISHIVFDKFSSDELECEFNEDEKSENPENWMVFKREQKEEEEPAAGKEEMILDWNRDRNLNS